MAELLEVSLPPPSASNAAARSFSTLSLSQSVMLCTMSSIAPVAPKNTRGAYDFFLIPTGMAMSAPSTENIHDLHQVQNTLRSSISIQNQFQKPRSPITTELTDGRHLRLHLCEIPALKTTCKVAIGPNQCATVLMLKKKFKRAHA